MIDHRRNEFDGETKALFEEIGNERLHALDLAPADSVVMRFYRSGSCGTHPSLARVSPGSRPRAGCLIFSKRIYFMGRDGPSLAPRPLKGGRVSFLEYMAFVPYMGHNRK